MSFLDLQIEFTPELAEVFYDNRISVLVSTYQAGRVIAFGSSDGKRLHQIPFLFKKPMGIALQDEKIAIATLDDIQFLSAKGNIANSKVENEKKFDVFYIHRASYNTSMLDIHDIEFGKGSIWGVNTAFSCLCKFDVNYSFVPKWKPEFISDLVPEDRCHLNGMTMEDGLPKYVTALGASDQKEGWRTKIMSGGILMEVPSSKIILEGLAMPHSPRIINKELYLLESGNGNLIKVNIEAGTKEVVYCFNRFIRGMASHKGILFIGASKIRENSKTFNGLEVKVNSKYAGIIVFDLKKREIIGEINYITTVEEIFDVQIIEGYRKPAIINELDDRRKEVITTPNNIFWKKNKVEDI